MVDVLTNNSSPLEAKKSVLAPDSTAATPQYSPEFLNADAWVAYQEGGKTTNDGLGNVTSFGINGGTDKNGKPIHPGVDVPNLTPRQAQAIRYTYWQAINGDGWAKRDPKTALIAYDTAILNPQAAYNLLAEGKGDASAMYKLRVDKINEFAQSGKYPQSVITNWINRTTDLGQTVGLAQGTPRTPPVQKLIGPEGVYVPAGYSADTNTPAPAGKGGGVRVAQNVSPLTPPESPPESPPEPANSIEQGIAGAVKAQQEPQKPLELATPKTNIPLPTEPIGLDQKQAYAKALDKIAQRNAATQPTQASPVYMTPPTTFGQAVPSAPLGATGQPSAPKQEQVPQNDEAA